MINNGKVVIRLLNLLLKPLLMLLKFMDSQSKISKAFLQQEYRINNLGF